ncbi:HoxN/HupN/NixA family nickel/cobalt transporter [Pseudodesulfovibrio piezophilus]|uniref:Nickel/cobalt efflux system n=1 Tax=Pseudodesulfovibrio piezophilus (strain DSM 21447 / JCM 15486 / C1TLV30) TaxID=1322246 RepID=M1WKI3_PSEP2|nr:DUF1007 family protein [Pseudodesulfovibrio piezophilus]CCH49651.1 High-affinity nickel-transporter [Pseudodesulfovibrio piezophilus C1TLV30]
MNQFRKATLIFIIWATLGTSFIVSNASAHPHVYVDAALTFVLDDSGLAAIRQNWTFDEIFSNAILSDLNLTPTLLATPEGQATIKDGAFAYLANYKYFTFIENNGKQLPVQHPENFKASVNEGRLIYDFTIPLHLPIKTIHAFRVAVFDEEYYTDILLLKDEIRFEIDGMVQVSHVIRPAKDHTYWQFIVPEAVHLSVSGTPGDVPSLPAVSAEEDSPGPIEHLMTRVRDIQKILTLKLNGFGMEIRKTPIGSALWMFLGFSFLYGIVHAIGPGHGKTVVCSYFLSNPGTFLSGAIMGNTITFVHMGSAAVAVGAAYLVFSTGMGGFAAASRALQPASYALLGIMGLCLLIKAVRDIFRGGILMEAPCGTGKSDTPAKPHLRSVLLVSFITGLIPCPGAAVILAFSIGQDILWAGMGAIISMAIGMGLTTTLFAWAAVAARSATLTVSGVNRKFFNVLYAALSLCGAAGITLFGAVLFMSSNVWH